MRNNEMVLNNRIFVNCKDMSATSFYVYVCIKQRQVTTGEDNFTICDIIEDIGLAKSTLMRNVKELVTLGYIGEKKTYNSELSPCKIYPIVELEHSVHGYSNFNLNFVKKLTEYVKDDKLNKRHLEIVFYLKYKELQRSKTWKISQAHISRGLGITRNAINISLKNLNKSIVNDLYSIFGEEFEYIYDFLK